ncbi:prolyl aminopeptidase [Scheffersomyces coipomensis]|uniref:prolyl aminopeptidase n=1 Tax=Scheffersomyces coipomensis TaxID=1788519 RepID=UPI00315D37FC
MSTTTDLKYEVIDHFKVKEIINTRLLFKLPLSYADPSNETKISVVVNVTQKFDETIHKDTELLNTKLVLPETPKLISYIQGGPGFPCGVPLTNSGYTKVLIDKGYQIVYLDQRGTGLSTALERRTFEHLVPKKDGEDEATHVQRQLDFILNFRADSIVEDYERVRRSLIGDEKWTLLGQSYGGFTSFTYVSKYPNSLKEVLVTGGVPPINFNPDDVYHATYERTKERNIHYFNKYPQDKQRMQNILGYLQNNDVKLPNGGTLSVERFQQLGLSFGGTGGTDNVHQLVVKFDYDLKLFGFPTFQILNTIQNEYSFDTNIIYALFQESIYCDANNVNLKSSDWSADRLRYLPANDIFVYNSNKEVTYFTGEMVYKSMFEDYVELQPFKKLGYALHANKKWSKLYDTKVLHETKVPIVAATYVYDQYVDFDLTRKVKENVFKGNGNLKQFITSEFFHNGVRAGAEKVLGSLFDLLDCEID